MINYLVLKPFEDDAPPVQIFNDEINMFCRKDHYSLLRDLTGFAIAALID
jgi:hypothetical protein